MNGDIRVAEHANSDQSEVAPSGEGSKRERLSRMLVAERGKLATRASGPLSRRETQLLRFAIQGLTNNEIASRLRLSATAVKRQLRSTFASLARSGADRPGDAPGADEPARSAADTDSSAAEATGRRG